MFHACKYCGNRDCEFTVIEPLPNKKFFGVRCKRCNAHVGGDLTLEQAFEHWSKYNGAKDENMEWEISRPKVK